jgi:transcription antitermination factor NusA-like protein
LYSTAPSKPSLDFLHAADEHLREKVTLSLYVPIEQVGIVIGKKGAKIKYIQDASHARVNVEPTKDGSDSAWSLVTVRGNSSGCLTAARVIAGLVEELDDCVAQFPVSKSRQVQVIGKGGETIRRISADTNVRIHVPGRKDEASNDVQLEGELDAVFKAVVEVVEAAYSGGGGDRSSHAESDGQEAGQGMKEGRATTPASPIASKEPPVPTIEETMSVSIPQLKVLTQGSTSSAMLQISRHTGTRIKKEPKPRKEKENEAVSVGDKSEPKNKDEEEGEDGEGGGEGGGTAAQSTSSVSSGGAVENGGGGDGGVQADVEVPSSTINAGEQGGQEETLVKIHVSGTDEKAVLAAVAALREVGEKQTSLNEVIARLKTEFPAFRSGHGGRPKSGGGSGRGAGGSRGNKRGGGNSSKPRGGGGVNGNAGGSASVSAT